MNSLALGLLLTSVTICRAFHPTNTWTIPLTSVTCSAAFVPTSPWTRTIDIDTLGKCRKPSSFLQARMEDEDDDDDDYIEDTDLGDWRSFRNTLVGSGISYESTEEGYLGDDTEKDENGNDAKGSQSPNAVDASKGSSNVRPKSVSKANEELLEQQSEILAKEYKEGVWAHEASFAEVGGLVVRMPLEAEIYRNKDKLTIGKELTSLLDNSGGIGSEALDEPISEIEVQTLNWYKKAQALIKEEMTVIGGLANERGEVDPTGLPSKTESLLKLYLNNQENWQSVCLVAEKDDTSGNAITYTLNRPMAFSLSESAAKMVLFGAMSNIIRDGRVPLSETNKYSKFLRAFEKQCAIYVGGRSNQDKPAVMIHGISDLEGATEISPGTGVYVGGVDAAIDGVLDGRYKPLDFRFFIGCNSYEKGGLDVAILSHKFQPIACARSLALKQCIQLPKPLWHEVMEMCGGELREISRLELKKRTDLASE